jgi:hypothetical protein
MEDELHMTSCEEVVMEKSKATLTPQEWKIAADRIREVGQRTTKAASNREKDTAHDLAPAATCVDEPSH